MQMQDDQDSSSSSDSDSNSDFETSSGEHEAKLDLDDGPSLAFCDFQVPPRYHAPFEQFLTRVKKFHNVLLIELSIETKAVENASNNIVDKPNGACCHDGHGRNSNAIARFSNQHKTEFCKSLVSRYFFEAKAQQTIHCLTEKTEQRDYQLLQQQVGLLEENHFFPKVGKDYFETPTSSSSVNTTSTLVAPLKPKQTKFLSEILQDKQDKKINKYYKKLEKFYPLVKRFRAQEEAKIFANPQCFVGVPFTGESSTLLNFDPDTRTWYSEGTFFYTQQLDLAFSTKLDALYSSDDDDLGNEIKDDNGKSRLDDEIKDDNGKNRLFSEQNLQFLNYNKPKSILLIKAPNLQQVPMRSYAHSKNPKKYVNVATATTQEKANSFGPQNFKITFEFASFESFAKKNTNKNLPCDQRMFVAKVVITDVEVVEAHPPLKYDGDNDMDC